MTASRKQPKQARPTKKRPASAALATEGSASRAALLKRMWRAADAQVREIEKRLSRDGQAPLERERDARVLAVLAKTLRELTALDEANPAHQVASADDDTIPRDVDELRRSLAQKLEALVARDEAEVSGEPSSA